MSSVSTVSNIDPAEILASIAKLESDLAKLKIACGATGVVVPTKSRKSAKPPAADGEKKAPNAWIVFTQKVDGALKAASIATGAATVSKQFASSLKDIKPYPEWDDAANYGSIGAVVALLLWLLWRVTLLAILSAMSKRRDRTRCRSIVVRIRG